MESDPLSEIRLQPSIFCGALGREKRFRSLLTTGRSSPLQALDLSRPQGTAHKWLDIAAMSAACLPTGYQIQAINYYTAHISGRLDPTAPARQKTYLRVLETLPKVAIYYGVAAVLTNDTDLVEPIRIVTKEIRLPVTLLTPCARPATSLVNVSTASDTSNLICVLANCPTLFPFLVARQLPDPRAG
jgi:hypothetical protein